MEDDDDIVVKKRKTQKVKRVESDNESDGEDMEASPYRCCRTEFLALNWPLCNCNMNFDVVVCNELPNTELYRVHFPVRKRDAFDSQRQPRVRYKKNVRMMEVRLAADVSSGSFDKAKAERFAVMGAANVKSENPVAHSKFDEVYEGRAYVKDDFVQFAVGYFRGNTFYVNPIAGTFDMHRSLTHLNYAGKGGHGDEEEMTGESDTEAVGTSAKQVRVKFTRPETERQKKRREASALHREKLIASDSWIPMDVHLKEDPSVSEKFSQMTILPPEEPSSSEIITARDLVERGIICGEKEQIDLTRSELLVTHQRIREMPIHQQVKAQMFKSRVIATADIAKLVDPSITRDELFVYLKECAHLVQGVWVFKSEFLYHDLTAAHAVTPGKLDEHRADMWRCARDLALCLLDAGQKVTRSLLTRCFQVNSKDAEDILSSFAVPGNRSWKLRITPDPVFLESPENAKIVLEERRYWTERWAELQVRIDTTLSLHAPSSRTRKNSVHGSPTKSPTRTRHNSTRGSPTKHLQ
ncbi:Sin protein region [Trichostrongylus colubriformis]|uniref:Sin protein region n=1 Tax=Trichostrongylus colubriformis TaxID=6319 RepID=A0AAN8ICU1_TRICO